MTTLHFGYEDWTLETVPRCFYVGIGNRGRFRKPARNRKHMNVKNKYGSERRLLLTSTDRAFMCQWEITMIALHHTFIDDPEYNGVGCNLTPGGEKHVVFSSETIEKMRQAKLGSRNFRFGKKDSEETKAKRNRNVSLAKTGVSTGRHSVEWNERIRLGNVGKSHKPRSLASRLAQSERLKGLATPMKNLIPWNKGLKTGPMKPEVVKQRSDKQRGLKRSETTRRLMREKALLREAQKRSLRVVTETLA